MYIGQSVSNGKMSLCKTRFTHFRVIKQMTRSTYHLFFTLPLKIFKRYSLNSIDYASLKQHYYRSSHEELMINRKIRILIKHSLLNIDREFFKDR